MDCPDCKIEMQPGFLLEYKDFLSGAVDLTKWHPGEPEIKKAFGIQITTGIGYDRKKAIPIASYRCPECGLLRSYAQTIPTVETVG